MKNLKRVVVSLLLIVTLVMPTTIPVSAAVKLNKTALTLTVGKSYNLKLVGTKSKVVWSSNKKAVATVNKTGKVTAKSAGKAVISARVGKKSYNCRITVKGKNEKSLEDLQRYLEKKGVVKGEVTELYASMVDAKKAVRYEEYDVEIYEYDISSKTYKDIVKTNKINIKLFDYVADVAGINGKFVILFDNNTKNEDKILEAFMEF